MDVLLTKYNQGANVHIGRRLQQCVKAGAVALTPGRYTPRLGDWQPAASAPGSLVVFTAADPGYFRKFAPAFLSSLVRQHPSVSVHFHLFDPDRECLAMLARWRSQLPAIEIGYSTERLPKSALRDPKKSDSKQSWKSLFICCARFLAARHLQQERGVAILLMDIDVIFAGRLEGIFAGAHYGLMPRLAQKNWCKRTLGGAVFVSSSPLGRAFLDHACLHIRKFLTLGLYWFAFDQYALYRALLHMKRHDGLANFRALTSAHVSFDLSAKAPILYPKGRSKGSKEFELLAKSATLPEPVRETANISEAVLPQIQLAANENLSESFEICAG